MTAILSLLRQRCRKKEYDEGLLPRTSHYVKITLNRNRGKNEVNEGRKELGAL